MVNSTKLAWSYRVADRSPNQRQLMKLRFIAMASVALALFFNASCAHKVVRVKEVSNPHPTAKDPALYGEEMTLLHGPPPPPQFEEKGALFTQIQWLPTVEFDLKPGEAHALETTTVQGATLFARASWRGGSGPVTILVMKDNSVLASGTSYIQAPNRGIAFARSGATAPGTARVFFRNGGPSLVKVKAIVGMLVGG
jgi:hypothetical protein